MSSDNKALLVSEPHWRLPNGAWSGGGPFLVHKRKVNHTGLLEFTEKLDGGYPVSYRLGGVQSIGAFSANPISIVPPDAKGKLIELLPFYTEGRARTQPGRPVAGQGQFLWELYKDGIPKIPLGLGTLFYRRGGIFSQGLRNAPKLAHASALSFRNLGSQYLNVEFGWKPFVRDLRDLYGIHKELDKAMAKLLRENNQGIHRKATLDEDTSVEVHKAQSIYNFSFLESQTKPATIMGGSSSYTRVRTVKTKRWFSARYHYHIPESSIGSWQWNLQARTSMMGLLPTPELIWNVLPWSWLIDWFTNVGDIMRLLSYTPAENLYTDYAFIMEHVQVHDEMTVEVDFPGQNGWGRSYPRKVHTFRSSDFRETKARTGGYYLFGLGMTGRAPTGKQLSILAALGASRSRL